MAEADLQKERLQALALKRKRQTEIEEKRRKLEDLILRLQHLKSKAMRERWLLQGTSAATQEEEEERRKQTERDEEEVKNLEETVYRLEKEIDQLKNEESEISAKELILRERLRISQGSGVDLQSGPLTQEREAENYISSQNPDHLESHPQISTSASEDKSLSRIPVCAMEINVQKDRKTGDTKILSASAVSPEDAQQRGVKVFDDGYKAVYEMRSGQPLTVENGIHAWTSSEVDKVMQLVNQPYGREAASRLTVTSPDPDTDVSNRCLGKKEQGMHKEAKLEMVPGSQEKEDGNQSRSEYKDQATDVQEATPEKPVTMIFMGYHNVEDDDETKRHLGFNGTIKAEIVLIDEDDEKSLREKTVTDISTMDGNAADLVSGQPLSDTTEPSSEVKDESSDKELPPPVLTPSDLMGRDNGLLTGAQNISTAEISSRISEDARDLKRAITSKTVSFSDSVNEILAGESNMEAPPESQDECTSGSDMVKYRQETLDSNIAKEGFDKAQGANCWNPNATSEENSPVLKTNNIADTCPSFRQDTAVQPPHDSEATIGGMKQTAFMNNEGLGTYNGHSRLADSDYKRLLGVTSETTTRKEPRFELRAFQEEKKPCKLFDTSEKEQIHVKKVRPSEEIAELERERLELIRGQAVKKNPGIAAKWWNPPQEKTLEEELDPEQLESHRKYEERKQRRPEMLNTPASKQTPVLIVPPEPSKEDIVMEQIDFSAARNQFLQMENDRPPRGSKRDVTPKIYSAKPFRTSNVEKPNNVTADSYFPRDISQVTTVKPQENWYILGDPATNQSMDSKAENEVKDSKKIWIDDGDFTHARAVMTFLKDDEPDISMDSSFNTEESDSGLDRLSVKSEDSSMEKNPSHNFSSGNVSNCDTSNETAADFLETSHITQTVNSQVDVSLESLHRPFVSKDDDADLLTEEQLEKHAGILVQNAIQQAIAQQSVDQKAPQIPEEFPSYKQNAQVIVQPLEESNKPEPSLAPSLECRKTEMVAVPMDTDSSSYTEPLDQSPTASKKQEFSYFSKYSQAAELRSTASVTRNQEQEVSLGPFKLRSHKQRTLCMIEEEIRATQEREEELKRQRQTQSLDCSLNQNARRLHSKLSPTGRTTPGTIEKIRGLPPVLPSAEGPPPHSSSDTGNEDSGGSQRPKNFMQTLMEDYETHKVKRRSKTEDTSVSVHVHESISSTAQ